MRNRQEPTVRHASTADWSVALLSPLLVWGAYFLYAYILVALACARGWSDALLMPLLGLGSVAALVSLLLLGRTFRERLRRARSADPDACLTLRAGLVSTLLAGIATVWTALPILLVPPCE
jgi:hypothetical protein